MTDVLVPPGRWVRWVANFETRQGETRLAVADGALRGDAANGASFVARLPFDAAYAGPPDVASFAEAVAPPEAWGVLLVRKGGFAVARLERERVAEHKIGRRHVQGRTKAGGQSQQRFARRRENQARQAFEAATEHAVRLLAGRGPLPLVTGGDRTALEQVLSDPRLGELAPVGRWLPVPDPRREVLDRAVGDACAVAVSVADAGERGRSLGG